MSYIWNLPTKVLFGAGMLNELEKQKMPGKRALLVISNGKSVRDSGSLERVIYALVSAGVDFVLFDKIPQNPTEPIFSEGVRVCREKKCDFVMGLGGGSVMDAATIISAIAPQSGGCLWDYVRGGTGGGRILSARPLPYITITTTAGTGSEVNRWGMVINPTTHERIGFCGGFADIAIVDPELTITVPPLLTAYQGFDALFQSIDGYLSKFCSEAAEMCELTAIENIAKYLPAAVEDGFDMDARTKISFANVLSGYSMELSYYISAHAMALAMSGYHDSLPNGAGLIMLSEAYFTKWIESHVCDERFVTLAKAMGKTDASAPEDFIAALKELQEKCGVSGLKMSDYGITPDEFPMMAHEAKTSIGILFMCDRFEMNEEDVVEIYKKSYK